MEMVHLWREVSQPPPKEAIGMVGGGGELSEREAGIVPGNFSDVCGAFYLARTSWKEYLGSGRLKVISTKDSGGVRLSTARARDRVSRPMLRVRAYPH